MPRRTFRRRRSYRRITRRPKRVFNGRRRTMGRRRYTKPLITPDRKNLRLKYIETTRTSFSGGVTSLIQVYKLNSAYDLSGTLGNTATPGFAEWKAFYNRYRVNMAVVKCTFSNVEDTPCYVGVWSNAYPPSNVTNWTTLMESRGQKYSKCHLLGASNGGGANKTLTLIVPMARIVGNRLKQKADDRYEALMTTDPASLVYGYVWVASFDGAGVIPQVACRIEITQYVTVYERAYLTT